MKLTNTCRPQCRERPTHEARKRYLKSCKVTFQRGNRRCRHRRPTRLRLRISPEKTGSEDVQWWTPRRCLQGGETTSANAVDRESSTSFRLEQPNTTNTLTHNTSTAPLTSPRA